MSLHNIKVEINQTTDNKPILESHYRNVAVGIIKRNDTYLLLLQNKLKAWTFPMGKIEGRELAKQALIREMYEELDIVVNEAELLAIVPHYYETDTTAHYVTFHCYEITLFTNEPYNKEPTKHQALGWVTLNMMKHQFLSNPSNPVDFLVRRFFTHNCSF